MGFSWEEFPNADYYNSDLRQILDFVRKMYEHIESYDEVIASLQEAVKDIDSMKDAILALQVATSDLSIMRNNISRLTDDVANINATLDNIEVHFNSLHLQLNLLREYVDSENYAQDKRIEEYRITLQRQIDELRQLISDIDTDSVNPWHTELGKVELAKNFRLTYGDLADECPTAQEYARLGLSASDYAELELPAIEYCTRGKKHLHMYWVYAPVYGWRQEISNVLTSIVDYIKGTMSASDYSALDMTADEYASLDLTAENYFSYGTGSGYVTISPSNTGLTKLQYERLGI